MGAWKHFVTMVGDLDTKALFFSYSSGVNQCCLAKKGTPFFLPGDE